MSSAFWWYVTRSTGITAWAICAGSVIFGLALSTRALGKNPTAPWLLDLHRYLGGLSVVFVGVHLGSLVADNYTHWGTADLFVPFATSWKSTAVAWGIVSFYLLLAIEITSLLKRHIPKRWWHRVHMTSFGLYVVSTIHLLTAGTDRLNRPLLYSVAASLGLVVFFTTMRTIAPKRRCRQTPRPAAPTNSPAQLRKTPSDSDRIAYASRA